MAEQIAFVIAFIAVIAILCLFNWAMDKFDDWRFQQRRKKHG